MVKPAPPIPSPFAEWFAGKGWTPHPHQRELLAGARPGSAQLLVAPTGGGKTLAGFLPSLVELAEGGRPGGAGGSEGLHSLYISPLKALAVDIRRNLETPIAEMGLKIRVEDRTGDTKQAARLRQKRNPPHLLLTTPESLALLISDPYAADMFTTLKAVIVDEAHAFAGTKRGDQLTLCLARLRKLAPDHWRIGLSATVRDPDALAVWLDPGGGRLVQAPPGPKPDISILETERPPPWSSMNARYAAPAVMAEIAAAQTALVFINTRAQSELFFQALWSLNDDNLAIGLHHGSLAKETRNRVEAAMAAGALRGVVATSSLDLGIDWAAVDLVIQVGAPKGVARLIQRIGRANHRLDEPSRAILVPANRFDLIECRAAKEAVEAGEIDGAPLPEGGLDVLCQHILLIACAGPFAADDLYREVREAGAYRALKRADFDRCLDFCATGGYALRAYDRWKRLIGAGRQMAAPRSPGGPPHPHEYRHHRRSRNAQCAQRRQARRRVQTRRGGGSFRRHSAPRRYILDRRRGGAIREYPRYDRPRLARRRRAARAGLRRVPDADLHRAGEPGDCDHGEPGALGGPPGAHRRVAAPASRSLAACRGGTGFSSRVFPVRAASIRCFGASQAAMPIRPWA